MASSPGTCPPGPAIRPRCPRKAAEKSPPGQFGGRCSLGLKPQASPQERSKKSRRRSTAPALIEQTLDLGPVPFLDAGLDAVAPYRRLPEPEAPGPGLLPFEEASQGRLDNRFQRHGALTRRSQPGGPAERGPFSWSQRATTPLPLPVSPSSNTDPSLAQTALSDVPLLIILSQEAGSLFEQVAELLDVPLKTCGVRGVEQIAIR